MVLGGLIRSLFPLSFFLCFLLFPLFSYSMSASTDQVGVGNFTLSTSSLCASVAFSSLSSLAHSFMFLFLALMCADPAVAGEGRSLINKYKK